ncbi:MAG: DUF1772 domain-containing protein [Nitrospiraceae bacterium]
MTLCAGWFAGAALYITAVEHPARVQCGPALAVAEFGPSYRRAAVMQGGLVCIAMVSGLGVWLMGGGLPWLVWALVLGALIPFTLVVIMPTNKRLLDPGLDPGSSEASALLAKWGRLHAVRTVVGCAAFLGCLLGLPWL